MPTPKLFVLGAFVADLTCRTDRMARWGETILGNAFKLGPGGKGSNQAVAAARLGAEVTLATKLGRDAFGDMARSFYRGEGMSLAHVLDDPDESSGTATIVVDDRTRENAIIVVQGACAKLTTVDVEAAAEAIGESDAFLTQLELPIPPTVRGIELAAERQVPIILNPAPALPLPAGLLGHVAYLTPNEPEALGLLGREKLSDFAGVEGLADALLELGCANVVVTLGENGAYCKGAADPTGTHVTAFHAGPVLETTGAGDAFAGGFAVALAEGRGLAEATRFGCAVAGISVTRLGTAPSMPRLAEVEPLLGKANKDQR